MQSLAELQAHIAQTVIGGEDDVPARTLVGGRDPRRRLAIHRRHYEASLAAALRQKFPACAWLIGDACVAAAARAYVHAEPPRQPCIAEYGATFPRFLALCDRSGELPYLKAFATLEWAVGQVSIAIDAAPLAWRALARRASEQLLDTSLQIQPCVRYLRFSWAVDELLMLYMRETAPEQFALSQADAPVQVSGARGTVVLTRLEPSVFTFRSALAAGHTIGRAADLALDVDVAFDPGHALRCLVDAGLVSCASTTNERAAT